jgi:hypothetical protein
MGKKLGTKGKKERGHTQEKRREEKEEVRDKRETREKKEIEVFWVWGKRRKHTNGVFVIVVATKSRAFFLHSWKPPLCCCCCCNSNIIFLFLFLQQSSHFCKITVWQALFFLVCRSSHQI